ncbi:ABC transporter ATP-binding protein [Vagococcus xieshaowenii]|uniref:ABC transporter ATP-binding protein n=1 Tax=Vagococcus xieshaowenii TaxID=2562451 RepID=A0A4Z0DEU3_9ENTE|nr:ABC transporter ATP-binding protein [Vagococcus xieshaowenii]QCA29236.1 ABC transporter ATP-binding protein [Vagococcus xieshaowenii]TFZ43251.1 ABC transporter ATP-binding protein [Vagococcus xieshaowenii]
MNNATSQQFLTYLKPYRKHLMATLLLGIIGGGASVWMTYLTGHAIDQMIGVDQVYFSQLYPIMLYFALAVLLATITQWLVQRLANYISYQVVASLRKETFDKLNHLPINYFDTQSIGDITSRFTNDLDLVADALSAIFTNIFSGMTIVIISLITMFNLNIPLTLVILLATPFMFATTWIIAQKSQQRFTEQQQLVGTISNYVTEHVTNQKVIKAYQYEEQVQASFNEKNQRLNVIGQKAQFASSLTNPLSRFIDHLSYIALGLVGGYFILNGSEQLTVGLLSSFIIYSSQFTKPFIELSGITPQVQSALAGLSRVFQVVNQTEEPDDSQLPNVPTKINGAISFEQVYFSYQPERPLIEAFDLEVAPGETIAIVGQTGAGKSTLVNLLMRFYEPQQGSIQLDGVPINTYQRDSLRQSFGMVLQDTWLFDGTIRDNLLLGQPQASEEEIQHVLKEAKIDRFISLLPQQLDTVIGHHGISMSEGQRQLLTIARTMLANKPMLILDEATSSVDSLTEQAIQEAFLKLMKGKTCFVIAHRLATIKEADRILVMHQGSVVEIGTHDELLAIDNGYYQQLYNAQFVEEA